MINCTKCLSYPHLYAVFATVMMNSLDICLYNASCIYILGSSSKLELQILLLSIVLMIKIFYFELQPLGYQRVYISL